MLVETILIGIPMSVVSSTEFEKHYTFTCHLLVIKHKGHYVTMIRNYANEVTWNLICPGVRDWSLLHCCKLSLKIVPCYIAITH